MAEKVKQRCSERIFGGGRIVRGTPCGTPATVSEDGKWWCKRHTKEGKARRRAKTDERIQQYFDDTDRRIAQQNEMQRRYHLFPQLLKALRKIHRRAEDCHLGREAVKSDSFHLHEIMVESNAAIQAAKETA